MVIGACISSTMTIQMEGARWRKAGGRRMERVPEALGIVKTVKSIR